MTETPSQKPPKSVSKWQIASLAMELGFIIALPLVAFGLIGKRLDAKFGTSPWLTLVGTLLAIAATTVWLIRRFKEIINRSK
ncbi:MAG: AtpZ/AtpI family protein [Candidatus Doudnabacteria bacterium]|nr:AtpZ/AtpI family protein [Candidatus Doudnabacteria bacterium]